MEIGQLGAFCFLDAMTAQESAAFCRRVERLGYKVLWTPEAWGRDPFAHGGYLLAKTDRLISAIENGLNAQLSARGDGILCVHACILLHCICRPNQNPWDAPDLGD